MKLKKYSLILALIVTTSNAVAATFPDQLMMAIQPGQVDWNTALALIYKAIDQKSLNELGQSGQPAIMLLLQGSGRSMDPIEAQALDVLISLLMNSPGFDANAINKYQETVIIELLRSYDGHRQQHLEDLLKLKADPNCLGRWWSPLYEAVSRKDQGAVELLLCYGANVDSGSKNGTTPVHRAIKDGSYAIADILIQHKADLEKKNENGESATTALKRIVPHLVEGSAKSTLKTLESLKLHLPISLAQLIMGYLDKMKPMVATGGFHICAINSSQWSKRELSGL